MLRIRSAAAFAAASSIAFHPCLAADDFRASAFTEQRTAAFAGASLRIPLGAREAARPSLRLQLTPAYYSRDPATSAIRSRRPEGLEIGASGGRPALFVAGQPASGLERRMNAGGSTGTTLLIVGGVVVVAVLLVAVAASNVPPSPGEGDF